MPAYATNPADLLKIVLLAFVGVALINAALRAAGLAQYTTKGS
jgi:hypothetical protein